MHNKFILLKKKKLRKVIKCSQNCANKMNFESKSMFS